MESFNDFVRSFTDDIQKRCGRCYAEKTKTGRYGLYKYPSGKPRGLFAMVHEQKERFRIATPLGLVKHAGVERLADKIVPHLWFGKDGCWFDVLRSGDQGYQKAVVAIAEVCRLR